MYYFKKLALIRKKEKLLKLKGKLIIERKKSSLNWNSCTTRIEAIDIEIDGINEILEYLQKEKPKSNQKVSNNSFIATAKNDSGARIEFPPSGD